MAYTEHKNITTLSNEITIWRYMDLWKFLDIIDNKELYLTKINQFEDKLEGRAIIKNKNHKSRKIDDYAEFSITKEIYVSSWTLRENETYPLWKIYSNYRTGIAIKSNVGRLIESVKNNKRPLYLGKVEYKHIDEKEYVFKSNYFQLILEKRDYFQFEKEVRLIMRLPSNDYDELLKFPKGITIDIDVDILIDEIYLAPLANNNFKNLIELKMNDLGLNKSIKFSNI